MGRSGGKQKATKTVARSRSSIKEDSPADVSEDRTLEWKNDSGQLHRIGAPARIMTSKRTGGVAVERQEYWENGQLIKKCVQRSSDGEDGGGNPWSTVEIYDADGRLHSEDGPAYIYKKGGQTVEEWYKDGILKQKTTTEGSEKTTITYTGEGDGPDMILPDGSRHWHRDDFLKSQTEKGTFWYNSYGDYDREDGPAVIFSNPGPGMPEEEWYKKGLLNREDGPARIYKDGKEEWYKDNKLHREDGPAVIYPDGGKKYYQNGLLHREDGPAVIFVEGGEQKYYQNGELHRIDGPAIIYPDGRKEYWVNGKKVVAGSDLMMKIRGLFN